MTTKEIQTKLGTENVRKFKGEFKYWVSYFWGMSTGAERLVAKVTTTIPEAVITGHGNHHHAFVGSAKSGSPKDSHRWVTFTIPKA